MTTATAVEAAEMPGRDDRARSSSAGSWATCCWLAPPCGSWRTWSSAPSQTLNSLLVGVGNGALYALIALGYTLVYGIIELINFAHGDLFMLGTVFSGFMMVDWLRSRRAQVPAAWAFMLLTLVAAMAFCGIDQRRCIECVAYRRLRQAPKLAPLITAVGMSFILQWVGLRWNGSAPRQWPTRAAAGGFSIGGVTIAVHDHRRRRLHDPAAAAADLGRPADPAGQGDARHRAGPGRRAADGHQRQPHHRLHVRPRRRDGRRGRPDVPRSRSARRGTTSASSSA